MAQVAQSISLLAAVRAQLSLDSDSESSPSPGAVSLNDKPTTTTTIIHDRTGEGHATETRSTYESKAHEQSPSLSMGISKTSNRHPSDSQSTHTSHTLVESSFLSESATLLEGHPTNDHEAFPEYDEAGTPAYIEDEEAYKEAFVAAMQEKIRMQEVEPFIDDIPEQTENKQKAMEDMKDCLSDPHLHATTRERFIALTNMIIRLEHILFHRSDEFLRPQETTEAQQIAAVLLGYVAWADGMLTELLEATYPVRFVLGELMKEDVSEVIRYRRMACVVAA